MYDYLDAITHDVLEYIDSEIDPADYESLEDLEEFLNDELFLCDSVTGNASGSYTFNRFEARGYVVDNIDLLCEACMEFGIEDNEVGRNFLNEDFEWMDVIIRCYLLSQAISKALEIKFQEGYPMDDEVNSNV